jgi:ribose-phosphate pyrophosphokinase
MMTKRFDFVPGVDTIFFPDAGAHKRYSKMFSSNVFGIKDREFETGKILSYEVSGEIKDGSTVFIVDDLCSKGGTFILAANKLKELGAKRVILITAHCENTIKEGEVLKVGSPIDWMVTTDSILTVWHELNSGHLSLFKSDEVYLRG